MTIEKGFNRKYNCPICELRAWLIKRLELNEELPPNETGFLGQLGEEIKSMGFTRGGDWKYCLDSKSGPVIDDKTTNKIPVGVEIPGYGIMTDVCPICGTVYSTHLSRIDAIIKPRLERPGLGGRDGPNPFFSN